MAGSNQKDFFPLIVDNGSCMVKAGFTGYDTPCACSLWFACLPVVFGIMAGMDQKNTFSVGWFSQVQFLDKVTVQTVLTVWKCRCSAVAVHRRSSTSLSLRRVYFPRSRLLSDQRHFLRLLSALSWWTTMAMCGFGLIPMVQTARLTLEILSLSSTR